MKKVIIAIVATGVLVGGYFISPKCFSDETSSYQTLSAQDASNEARRLMAVQGEEIAKAIEEKTSKIKAYEATLIEETDSGTWKTKVDIRISKLAPNYYRREEIWQTSKNNEPWRPSPTNKILLICDGQDFWEERRYRDYRNVDVFYIQSAALSNAGIDHWMAIQRAVIDLTKPFYGADLKLLSPKEVKTVVGVECLVFERPDNQELIGRKFVTVGVQDGMMRKLTLLTSTGKIWQKCAVTSLNLKPNLTPANFQYSPPPGASVRDKSLKLISELKPDYRPQNDAQKVQLVKEKLRFIAVALEAHFIDHEIYPPNLYALTSPIAYISHIPKDLFTEDADFKYKRIGRSDWILWSVGPNELNENGKGDDIVRRKH